MITVLFSSTRSFPINRQKIRQQIEQTLQEMRVQGDVEVSVTIVGDRKMRELNKQYRGIDDTTDVLSFPLEEYATSAGFATYPDNVLRLGDIIVSYPQAVLNAHEHNVLVDDEIDALVEHSIQHLLGIHHEGD